MCIWRVSAAALLVALPPGIARAAGGGELKVLEVGPEKERLECPKEQPALLITAAHDGEMELRIEQQIDEGASPPPVVLTGHLTAGKVSRQSWPQEGGSANYLAKLSIQYDSGKTYDGVMGFTFHCAPPIAVTVAEGGLDLGKGRIKLTVVGPAARAEVEILDESGGELLRKTIKLKGKSKGSKQKLALKWPVDEQGFGGLDLKVYDRHGFWVGLKLTPFSLEIPHEEVTFASGKWEIRPSEEPKLEDTLSTIREELDRFVDERPIASLYIIGYTDSVGSKADNRKLSTNRARSIGRWFKSRGLASPLLYQGFGEDVLAIETGDETAEEANRRAVYILTNFPPPKQRSIPRTSWKRLR